MNSKEKLSYTEWRNGEKYKKIGEKEEIAIVWKEYNIEVKRNIENKLLPSDTKTISETK